MNSILDDLILKIDINTKMTDEINIKKANILESIKLSTKEDILYFLEKDLKNIPDGFSKISEDSIKNIEPHIERRSKLEYIPMQRHPIPYCIIKFEDKYFLSLRKNGGGELRLIGQKGLLGGHVDRKDISYSGDRVDIVKTIRNGMLRELREEADLDLDNINNIEFLGFIKINKDGVVENDHLGLVYIIDISSKIEIIEDNVLSGIWLSKEEIMEDINSLENWTKISFENLFWGRFFGMPKKHNHIC